MPFPLWDDTIEGSGQHCFGDNKIAEFQVDVLTRGVLTRETSLGDADSIMRFGWVAFGRIENEFTEPIYYWREPIWINFDHFQWTPVPQYNNTSDLTLWAHCIRWHINPGGQALIRVQGA